MAERKVPLIESRPLSEFGDFDPSELFDSRPRGLERDGTYVPGFSEMRVARDTAVGQFNRGEISRSELQAFALPVNCRWARGQTKAGQPDTSKPFGHTRKGYRYAGKDDVGQAWLKEVPGGCQWAADGTLRNGDSVLMVCDAKDAARNEMNKRRDTDERINGVSNTLEQNLVSEGTKVHKGADLFVEKIPATAKNQTFGDRK